MVTAGADVGKFERLEPAYPNKTKKDTPLPNKKQNKAEEEEEKTVCSICLLLLLYDFIYCLKHPDDVQVVLENDSKSVQTFVKISYSNVVELFINSSKWELKTPPTPHPLPPPPPKKKGGGGLDKWFRFCPSEV